MTDIRAMGVVDQVATALKPHNRLAAALGAILGGFVPVATWWIAHHELNPSLPLWQQTAALLALGGLCYSAPTVYQWARLFVGHAVKAAGFVLLLEGVLVASTTHWLSLTALALLVAINGTATGCLLSLDRRLRKDGQPRGKANRRVSHPTPKRSQARLRAA